MDTTLRTFIAIDLPQEARDALTSLTARLKAANSDGKRRTLTPLSTTVADRPVSEAPSDMAPLLKKLLKQYAEAGLGSSLSAQKRRPREK